MANNKIKLVSNVGIITSGIAPTTDNLLPGQAAFGKINTDGKYHIFGNTGEGGGKGKVVDIVVDTIDSTVHTSTLEQVLTAGNETKLDITFDSSTGNVTIIGHDGVSVSSGSDVLSMKAGEGFKDNGSAVLSANPNIVVDASEQNQMRSTIDVFSKSEVQAIISKVYKIKGSIQSFSALVEDTSYTPEVGDVWDIKTAGGKDMYGVDIKAGDNIVYVGPDKSTDWDVISGVVDLSDYYNKEEVDNIKSSLQSKIDENKKTIDSVKTTADSALDVANAAMNKAKNIAFSTISEDDLDRFTDVTKLFSFEVHESGSPTITPNVSTGVYCYPKDVHMILSRSLTPTAYVNYMYAVSKDESATVSYKNVSLDIAKGGFICVHDSGFTISSNVDGQSSDGSGNSEGFNVTTFQAIVTEDIESSAIMSVYVTDDVQDDVTSKMYEYPFRNLLDKAMNDGFKKGDVVTVTADSTGSGSMPDFSLQALSLPFKFIDDTNRDKFTSLDKLYKVDGSSIVPTVDAGLYFVTEDIEFNLGDTLPFSSYVDASLSDIEDFNFYTGSCTLPKGSTVTIDNSTFSVSGPIYITYKIDSTGSSNGGDFYLAGFSLFIGSISDDDTIESAIVTIGLDEAINDAYLKQPFTKIISDYTNGSDNVNVGDVVAVKEAPHDSGSIPTLEFKSIGQDFTGQITDSNWESYQTMSQWKDVTNGSYIVTTDKLSVRFQGKRVALSSMFLGDTAYDETFDVDKGTIIQVYSTAYSQMSQYYNKKAVYFNSSHASATSIDTGAVLGGQPILVVFDPEDENNTQIFNMSEVLTACNMTSAISANAVAAAFNPTDVDKWKDKTAKWDTSNGFPQLTYTDDAGSKSVIPVTEINNDNFSNYDTLEKWMALDEGVYWFGDIGTSDNPDYVSGKQIDCVGEYFNIETFDSKKLENGYIMPCSYSMVIVSKSNETMSANAAIKKVYFDRISYVSGADTGLGIGGPIAFKWDTRQTYSAENVTVYDYGSSYDYSMYGVASYIVLEKLFGNIDSETDDGKYLKVVKNGSDYKFEAADIMETVEIPADSTEVQLTNNTESRWLGSHNAVSLKLPTADSQLTTYKSRVVFVTSTAPISLTVPDSVKWRGDDVSSGTFSIQANTQYTIDFWNDGFSIKANVMAWK